MRQLLTKILAACPPPIAELLRDVKRFAINKRGAKRIFQDIHANNSWDDGESVSGPGSNMEATKNVRNELPRLLKELDVKHLLDIPCGDANWISQCLPKDIKYTGGDIVPELIAHNKDVHGDWGSFIVCDLMYDNLPEADILLVRDCFIHLPNSMVIQALRNIHACNIPYILTTTYDKISDNIAIELGGFRPVNLCKAPFNIGPPIKTIIETRDYEINGKSLGLWRVDNIINLLDKS